MFNVSGECAFLYYSQGKVISVNVSTIVIIDVGKEVSQAYAIFCFFAAAVPYPDDFCPQKIHFG